MLTGVGLEVPVFIFPLFSKGWFVVLFWRICQSLTPMQGSAGKNSGDLSFPWTFFPHFPMVSGRIFDEILPPQGFLLFFLGRGYVSLDVLLHV